MKNEDNEDREEVLKEFSLHKLTVLIAYLEGLVGQEDFNYAVRYVRRAIK